MYEFYLDDTKGKAFRLPIPPERVEISTENRNEPVTLIDFGEVNILRRPGLKSFSFDFALPITKRPYAFYGEEGFKTPDYYLAMLDYWKAERVPVTFRIVRKLGGAVESWHTTDEWVSVEDYPTSEQGGDIIVSLLLKVWKKYEVIRYTAEGGTYQKVATARPDTAPEVKKTESWPYNTTPYNFSRIYTGDGERQDELLKANPELDPWHGIMANMDVTMPNSMRGQGESILHTDIKTETIKK